MITCLGISTRAIGNALFNYAILLEVAKKTGLEPIYPIGEDHIDPSNNQNIQQLCNAFHIPIKKAPISELETKILFDYKRDLDNNFHPSIFQIQDGTNIFGYFQNMDYYEDFESLKPSFLKEIEQEASSIFKKLNLSRENCVGLHVRRGDYVNIDAHPVIEKDYYEKAMEEFKGYEFLVMSDDLEWVKNNFNYENIHPIPYNKNAFVHLCAFSMCSHQIIANSTFSWWGATLNNNIEKRVIAPYTWMNDSSGNLLEMNICPKNWKRL
tara:strand:- start:1886 stop:2686 length:801 start_codon:yes stop_codon:yes gene_type:complete